MLLLGREAERRRLEELLGEARQGKGAALLIQGQPGVGKSTLLQLAITLAEGFTVLTARGLESESELPFAGLADLLQPLHKLLPRIPPPQAAALAGAIAIGPPVPGDRFGVYAATLSTLAAAAEESPVLAIVDDLHWLDSASAEALLFVGRRLENENVALLLARRETEPIRVDFSSIPQLVVGGLRPADAIELLQQSSQVRMSSSVASALAAATEGNPLALKEIPALLSPTQLAGAEALPEPPPAGQAIESAFMRRVIPLSETARRALLVASASESGEMATIEPALRCLTLSVSAFDDAEDSGLITVANGNLVFSHPLLRSAIYHSARPADRRQAHQALASALDRERSGASRRAWHLAMAAVGPDEAVAALLERAAEEARSRSGYAAAASALQRAARLSTSRDGASRRLGAAGEAARFAGQTDRAISLFEAALALDPSPIKRGQIQSLRGQAIMWRGQPMEAHRLLMVEAERVKDLDPALAVTMLLHAVAPCFMDGRVAEAKATAQYAYEQGRRIGGAIEAGTTAALAEALLLSGEADDAERLLLRSVQLAQKSLPAWSPLIFYSAFCFVCSEHYDEARRLLVPGVEYMRDNSLIGFLPYPLAVLADLEFRTGHWDAAYALATESVGVAAEVGQESEMCYSMVTLARIEAARGLVDDCRSDVHRALAGAEKFQTGSIPGFAWAALGLLEVGCGHYDSARDHLLRVREWLARKGLHEPGVIPYAPDLIECEIRLGHTEEAEALLDEFEGQTVRMKRNWVLACAARCRGLLADESSFERYFADALTLHQRTPTPFEGARTQLCFGEMLRRHRRRIEAREHLRRALDVFERLGAQPWIRRATAELAATGEHVRSRKSMATSELTPHELQVALLIAEGNSNQTAAARLFVSPKTIEAHLTAIYSKLGIHSRVQLARLFAAKERSLAQSVAQR